MTESFEKLYGKQGIDTPYEREKFTYRPELRYSKEHLKNVLPKELLQSIERSRTFTISQNLLEYDELIREIEQMLLDIEARNKTQEMKKLKELLDQGNHREVISLEKSLSSYIQTGDYEIYSVLYNMKSSMEVRLDFLDQRFRSQLTEETDIQKVQEAEELSIQEWEYLEVKSLEMYRERANHAEEYHSIDDESYSKSPTDITYETMEKLEKKKREKEIFHTSLSDTSYVHRNRYFMFLEVVERAKILVYTPQKLLDKNLKEFIISLEGLEDIESPKAHLIMEFRKLRNKHDALKGRMVTIDDDKESFASEKNYLYQQMELKTVEPMKNWLYDQEEKQSGALDRFAKYMVSSMKDTRANYEEILADLLNFYKSEANFYTQQIYFLKEKEEIRRFYRILEDLGEQSKIQGDWVDEYLISNGYTS